MLVHHSGETYTEAAKRAADKATEKLNAMINAGLQSAKSTLESVEANQPRDFMVPAKKISFHSEEEKGGFNIQASFQNHKFPVHQHALMQVGERAGFHVNTVRDMTEPDVIENFANALNTRYHASDRKYLVRSVKDEIRGFLSDKFRRIDSRPIVRALVDEATRLGAVPIDGRALETKVALKFVLPTIYEPIANEVMVFGLCFRNSDFGDGALYMNGFCNRLWCTNLAMMEDVFRQIHLGRKLSEELEFSNETYILDTKTTISAVKDVTKSLLSKESVERRLETIKQSASTETDVQKVLTGLRGRSAISKKEAEEVVELYNSADIHLLPAGQTAWRLSNAISLMAQKAEAARQLELEDLAGKVAGLQVEHKIMEAVN